MIDKMVHPFACLASTRCGNVPWSGTLMAMAATWGGLDPGFPLFHWRIEGMLRERVRERERVRDLEGGEG